jgi:hypothetical protein
MSTRLEDALLGLVEGVADLVKLFICKDNLLLLFNRELL